MTRLYKPDYLEQAVFEVLDAVVSEDLQFANQQHHELDPPYATLSVDSRIPQGQDNLYRILPDGTQIYHGQRRGTITMLFVGDLCNERAEKMTNALKRPEASALFRKFGPVLHSVTAMSLGPILLDNNNQVEQATAVDIQYRVAVVHGEVGQWIETIAMGYAYGLDPNGSDDTRGAVVVSKPGTTPPEDEVLIVVIDPPNGVLRAGGRTDRLPVTTILPFGNIAGIDITSSDPDIVEIVRPPAPAEPYLMFHAAGTSLYTVEVTDNAGRIVSDTVALQITA